MRHKKISKAIDNLGQRSRIQRNLFYKRGPLLLLHGVFSVGAGERGRAIGRDHRLPARKSRRNRGCELIAGEIMAA